MVPYIAIPYIKYAAKYYFFRHCGIRLKGKENRKPRFSHTAFKQFSIHSKEKNFN
jgi:hypothetical protein